MSDDDETERWHEFLDRANDLLDWAGRGVRSRQFISFVVLLVGLAIVGGVLWLSWQLAGPLNTILYAFLFLLTFGLLPSIIGLFGRATPFGGAVGKLHFILGQFAADYGWLVQLRDRYELAPGTPDHYWLDGEWYEITSGMQNVSILGWRPFGVIYHKDDSQLVDERADPAAETKRDALAVDGGTDVERGDVPETGPDATISGLGDAWLVDLKALYRSGLARAGNIDLVATAEEQTMRDEVGSGVTDEWSAVIGALVGTLIGLATGYVMFIA